MSVDTCIDRFKRLVVQAYGGNAADSGGPPVDSSHSEFEGHGTVSSRTYESSTNRSRSVYDFHIAANMDLAVTEKDSKRQHLQASAIAAPAIYPEVHVQLEDPPLRGTIDLILTQEQGDTIVEFKTGEVHTVHEVQSAVYSVLWWQWSGRQIIDRRLVYASGESATLPALTPQELSSELVQLKARVVNASVQLASELPPAIPEAEKCSFCSVRQMCDEYWIAPETSANRWNLSSVVNLVNAGTGKIWRDLQIDLEGAEQLGEGFVLEIGPVEDNRQAATTTLRLLCDIPSKFNPGRVPHPPHARLLSVSLVREANHVRVLWSRQSEVFWVG